MPSTSPTAFKPSPTLTPSPINNFNRLQFQFQFRFQYKEPGPRAVQVAAKRKDNNRLRQRIAVTRNCQIKVLESGYWLFCFDFCVLHEPESANCETVMDAGMDEMA